MALFDGITKGVQSAIGGLTETAGNWYERDFKLSEFASGTHSLTSGKWLKIGEYVVPPQQKYRWGYGQKEAPINQGYAMMDLMNDATTPVQIEGTVRFVVENANDIPKGYVMERRTEILRTTRNDRPDGVPFPLKTLNATEDEHLALYVDADADDTLNVSNSDGNLPVSAQLEGA